MRGLCFAGAFSGLEDFDGSFALVVPALCSSLGEGLHCVAELYLSSVLFESAVDVELCAVIGTIAIVSTRLIVIVNRKQTRNCNSIVIVCKIL